MKRKKEKVMLAIAIFFSVLSGLMTFVPYVMVYKVILLVFENSGNWEVAVRYGIMAVIAIVLRFLFQAVSMLLTYG